MLYYITYKQHPYITPLSALCNVLPLAKGIKTVTITNNPNYNCVTSRENPYLDTVTFKTVTTALAKQMQTTFLLDRLCCVTNTIPYILTSGNRQPSAFYNWIMNEVANNPKKYNCTRQELTKAYNNTFEILSIINASYRKNRKINDVFFKYGMTVLNDKYFEDVSNGKLNAVYFVDGMKKMANDLYKFKTIG